MRLYTYRCTVNTRMIAALRMGSDESHFNVSVGSDGQSHFNVSVGSDGQNHKTVYTNHNLSEEKGEPKRYQPNALPLGQTGSHYYYYNNHGHFYGKVKHARLLGGSGGGANSLDFYPASLKSHGRFYFLVYFLHEQWKAAETVNSRSLQCQL